MNRQGQQHAARQQVINPLRHVLTATIAIWDALQSGVSFNTPANATVLAKPVITAKANSARHRRRGVPAISYSDLTAINPASGCTSASGLRGQVA